MSRFRARATGVAAAGVLAVLLSACGSATGPELATTPDSQGAVLALPTTTAAPTPTPTSTAPPTPTTSRKPAATATRATPQAAHQAAHQAGPAVAWTPAAAEEFSGAAVDRSRWNVYDSVGAFGNGRRTPDAVTQAGGLLTITARPDDGGTSGGLGMTKGQLYGRWEFRARTDKGSGFGSAILLWPDSDKWPDDGELDIMEVPTADRTEAHTIIHYGGAANKTFGTATPGDFSQWHTFAFEWLPDRMTSYIDGKKVFETTDKDLIPTVPMHATIQLDQGPSAGWLPAPGDSTPAETTLQVDYMRVSTYPGAAAAG
ncbi:hypothetical protein GCM10009836_23200 [Pseudonocardia ailaonensis]|uniref:GH16 domain-containing protein n=1 Tax=Pseudonocardia ailaonensis TaxID=367279 RepID=A0ABN2N0X1_9PSEU